MQNYRFTGPPAPGTVRPTDPVVSELWRVQDQIRWILRRAKSDEDYEAALAAAAQATANAQVIAAMTPRVKPATEQAQASPSAPPFLIAYRDHTVEKAAKYWVEGPLLHYMTPEGAHVQTRLDLVDRGLSIRLNRELNLDFRLPD
jgi:hypothetical protein